MLSDKKQHELLRKCNVFETYLLCTGPIERVDELLAYAADGVLTDSDGRRLEELCEKYP